MSLRCKRGKLVSFPSRDAEGAHFGTRDILLLCLSKASASQPVFKFEVPLESFSPSSVGGG